MNRQRGALIVLGAAAVAVLASSILHVPAGDVALVSWRGGGTPDLRSPGISLRLPWLQRVRVYPQGAVEVGGNLAAASREGSALEIPYTARVRPDRQALLSLERDGGDGGAVAAVRSLLEQQLKRAVAASNTYDLASGATTGFLVSSTRKALLDKLGPNLEITIAKPILPPEVRATFDRAAIYGRKSDTGARIVLIGIDGGDWDMIDALVAQGKLPNLARVKKEGVWARLRSNVPTLSPLLWTTVATGKSPDRHGIDDFLVTDPSTGRVVPINSTFRRAKALWNILTEAGLSSDFIAWWATWPAESIEGHLISDRFAYSTFNLSGPKGGQGTVSPEAYASIAESLRVPEESVTYPQIARFLHITPDEFHNARAAASRQGSLTEGERSIDVMTRVLAATETYRRIALDLLQRESSAGSPARLFAVYFEGVDEVNHRFAHCAPPRAALCSEGDYRRFKDAVAEFYTYQDGIIGDILKRAGKSTVIILSDHGFASGANRPRQDKPFIEERPGLWHDINGIFLASGPLLSHGEISKVTLFDIAPTVLYLLGLAVPEDMGGRVLTDALAPDFVAAHPMTRVPSYEGLEGPRVAVRAEPDEAAEEKIKEQLRALGYIGGGEDARPESPGPAASALPGQPSTNPAATGPGPRGTGAGPSGVPSVLYHTNLGAVHLSKKQYEEAEAEFQAALRIDPSSPQALMGMAMVQEGRGNLDSALQYLQTVVRLKSSRTSVSDIIKIAELFVRMGKPLDGVSYLEELAKRHEGGAPREVALWVGIGMLDSAAGRSRDAEAALRRALSIDPASVPAMQELFSLYDGQGRSAELQPLILEVLRKNPGSAMHHIWLGLVLRRKGDLAGAEGEFKKAAVAAPEIGGALANLGSLYLQEGRTDDAVTVLREAIRKDPRNPESRTNLIVALGTRHDLEGARGLVQDAEEMGLRLPLFYNALAYALHVNGRNQEALETLQKSLRLDPRQRDALKLQAEIETGRQAGDLPYR